MPWEVSAVSGLRLAFVHQVLTLRRPVAQACRDFGVSRQAGYKWLRRYREDPGRPLADRGRRPRASPGRTPPELERAVLAARDEFGWGPRKLHALLTARGLAPPSARTVAAVLRRHGRVGPPPPAPAPPQRFERGAPNELWQCDFKGRLEVARRRVYPLTVLDDHSRFLLALRPCPDQAMATARAALWDAFGEFGLPEALLCDNAFGARLGTPGLSWFEARLLRLGARPLHGRPYHPQTPGKVERLHGTLERELGPRARRDTLAHFAADLDAWRAGVYNPLRPHEALGDVPPLARWRPSPRPRPAALPPVGYPPGAAVRTVGAVGDIRWRNYRILVGRGIAGERVRVEEADGEAVVVYAATPVRRLRLADCPRGPML
jgi:transposase InsO family protein